MVRPDGPTDTFFSILKTELENLEKVTPHTDS